MVICLERGADMHIADLMPMLLTVSCFSKIQMVLPFWYRITRVVLEKGPLNGCVCVQRLTCRVSAKYNPGGDVMRVTATRCLLPQLLYSACRPEMELGHIL